MENIYPVETGSRPKLDFITKGLNWKGLISFDADMKYIAKRTKTPTQYLATGRDENGGLQFKKVVEGSDVLTEKLENSSNKKIYFETSFNYNRTFAQKHDVTAMVLYMQKRLNIIIMLYLTESRDLWDVLHMAMTGVIL